MFSFRVFTLLACLCCPPVHAATAGEGDCADLFTQAEKAADSGNYNEAQDLYARAGKKCPTSQAETWTRRAELHWRQQQAGEAEKAFRQALALREAEAAEQPAALAQVLNRLGELYHALGRYREAKPLYERALKRFRQAKDDAGVSKALVPLLNNLGLVDAELGDYQEANDSYREALAIQKKLLGENHLDLAYTLNNLAMLEEKRGEHLEAERLYQKVLALKTEHLGEDHPHLATTLNNLALLYNNTGDYAQAEPLYRRALEIREKHLGADHAALATPLNNLALLYYNLGNLKQAETLYQRALELRRTHLGEDHPSVASTLHALALLHQSRGEYEQAEALYQQALNIWERAYGEDHPSVASSLNNLAALYRKQGNNQKAEAMHRHALAIREQRLGESHPDVANSLNNLALLYAKAGEHDRAEKLYLRALHIAEHGQAPEVLWLLNSNLADGLTRQDYFQLAIFFGKRAVNILQSLRINISSLDKSLQQSFLLDKGHVYETLADNLMNRGRLLEAQQVLAMFKEENYFDFISRDESVDVRNTRLDYTDNEQDWQRGFMEGYARVDQLQQAMRDAPEKEKREARRELADAWQSLADYLGQLKAGKSEKSTARAAAPPLSPGTASITLPPGVALLHYLDTEQHLRILLQIDEQSLTREIKLGRRALNRSILEFHQALKDPLKTPVQMARELYNQLIEPVAGELREREIKLLLLSLNGNLNYLPFAALHDGKQYLVEQYALSRHTVAAPRQKAFMEKISDARIAGLGLSEAVADFEPLPSVARELDLLIRSDQNDETGLAEGVMLLNRAFSSESLREVLREQYPLLHIASHFVFEPGTEQASYLLLGTGEKLTLADIRQDYRFENARLLTLSACDTAMGENAGGEIEGFATLAQHQGAGAVLATLWPVNDASTGALMQDFYSGLIEEKQEIAQALRRAQMAFIQAGREDGQSPHPYYFARPYYWAPFILSTNQLTMGN